MKISIMFWTIISFLAFAVISEDVMGREPKFMKNQEVTYKVPKFYKLVCNGTGYIDSYNGNNNTYTVTEYLTRSSDCPDIDNVQEKDIQAVK